MFAVVIIILSFHGVFHLVEFLRAFNWTNLSNLTKQASKFVGFLWMISALLFFTSAILLYSDIQSWWLFALAGIIISQILIFIFWIDAKFATAINAILLIPVMMMFAETLPTSFSNVYLSGVNKGINNYKETSILKEEEIRHLPLSVQKYIIYSGALGKEKIVNFKATFHGQIKPKPNSEFLDFTAEQFNFYSQPTRLFFIKSKMFGLPFEGLHIYKEAKATMKIKVASLFNIANAKGAKMDKSETVTFFNDMCFLAPATLIDKNIEWEEIDSSTARAKFTSGNNTISAVLYFNEKGQLINFTSKDRYESADGRIHRSYEWKTPLSNYKNFNGRKIASYGEAYWVKPKGDFCYGKFNLIDIKYNVQPD